jgi:hypothetical protein
VDELEIPEEIRTSAMEVAWGDWRRHLKEMKRKLTLSAAKAQLDQLAEWGHSRSLAAIRHSIKQSYKGIYEPNNYQDRSTTNRMDSIFDLAGKLDAKEEHEQN